MVTAGKDARRTYVQVSDAKKKRSRSITVYGMTPTEVLKLILQSVNEKRKAV
jgi:hypothetical protein